MIRVIDLDVIGKMEALNLLRTGIETMGRDLSQPIDIQVGGE